jgi:hypothetical protein
MTASACADAGAGNKNKQSITIARIGLSYNFGIRLSKVSPYTGQWVKIDPLSSNESLRQAKPIMLLR